MYSSLCSSLAKLFVGQLRHLLSFKMIVISNKKSHTPSEPQKKNSSFPLYWLFTRDPYNGLLQIPIYLGRISSPTKIPLIQTSGYFFPSTPRAWKLPPPQLTGCFFVNSPLLPLRVDLHECSDPDGVRLPWRHRILFRWEKNTMGKNQLMDTVRAGNWHCSICYTLLAKLHIIMLICTYM